MGKVYRLSDRIKIKIDDIIVTISPLSIHQKTEIQSAMWKGRTEKNFEEATKGVMLSIKYAVKGISGLTDLSGQEYKLEFQDGVLSDQSLDDVFNLGLTDKLSMVCASLIKGIPSEFNIEGVEFVSEGKTDPNL
jgi:hypothetical protein